jgi:hypothetical protein
MTREEVMEQESAFQKKAEIVISQLRADRDRLQNALDKIRAEIEQTDFDFGDFYDHTDTIIQIVLEIIDKYTTESEDRNDT